MPDPRTNEIFSGSTRYSVLFFEAYSSKYFTITQVDRIEKGILKDGLNFRDSDILIEHGDSEEQPTKDGVEQFLIAFSDYISLEMNGYHISEKDNPEKQYSYVSKYKNNTATEAKPSYEMHKVNPKLFDKVDFNVSFHTHLKMFSFKERLESSLKDDKFKLANQDMVSKFFILTSGFKPIEY